MTPIVTSRSVVARVAAASFWNRVTGRGPTSRTEGKDDGRNAADILRGPVAARIPRSPRYALRVPRSIAAVLLPRSPSSSPPAARRRPRPASGHRVIGGRLGVRGQGRPSIPVIVSHEQAVGPNRFLFSFLDPKTNCRAAPPDRRRQVAFIDLGDDPTPVAACRRRFVWAIEKTRGIYVVNSTCPRPAPGRAEFTTQAPGGPPETIRVRSTSWTKATTVGDRPDGARDDRPDRGRRRRRPRQDLDGPDARSGLLPDVGRRRARGAQAVHARLRDPEVLHQPAVRPDARPFQADRRGQPRRDVHQRRAVQAQAPTASSSRSSTQQPAPGDRRHQPVGPAVGAVDLRGRQDGVVQRLLRGRDHAEPSTAAILPVDHLRRLTAVRTARPRDGSATLPPSCVRYQTRTGAAVAWCSTRWPGGNWAPFSSVADREHDVALAGRVGGRSPVTLSSPGDRRRR